MTLTPCTHVLNLVLCALPKRTARSVRSAMRRSGWGTNWRWRSRNLTGSFELDPDNQGRYWKELTTRMRRLLDADAVADRAAKASLLQLVSDVREVMSKRDAAAHSTWLVNNTKPGHVTGHWA
jgi:hypothetical protein